MHKATPETFRSIRQIAEKKNRPGGFEPDPDYYAQGGVPKIAGVRDAAPASDPAAGIAMPNKPSSGGVPFALAGSKGK